MKGGRYLESICNTFYTIEPTAAFGHATLKVAARFSNAALTYNLHSK
jgi:hypothetical protein